MDEEVEFVKCNECKYLEREADDVRWCNYINGLPCYLRENDGCTRGVRKNGQTR